MASYQRKAPLVSIPTRPESNRIVTSKLNLDQASAAPEQCCAHKTMLETSIPNLSRTLYLSCMSSRPRLTTASWTPLRSLGRPHPVAHGNTQCAAIELDDIALLQHSVESTNEDWAGPAAPCQELLPALSMGGRSIFEVNGELTRTLDAQEDGNSAVALNNSHCNRGVSWERTGV